MGMCKYVCLSQKQLALEASILKTTNYYTAARSSCDVRHPQFTCVSIGGHTLHIYKFFYIGLFFEYLRSQYYEI